MSHITYPVFLFIFILTLTCIPSHKKILPVSQAIPKPLDIILLLDQSSSMKETDPENNRIEAAKFLVDYLASYWAKEQDHRIGLVNFGDLKPPNPEDEVGGLISLDSTKLKERQFLLEKIKPLDLRYTKFIDALRKAQKAFEEAKKDIPRQKVIIILTDGEPDDPRRLSRDAYFREIIPFFNDSLKDCQLCVIGIDKKDRYWSSNKPYWNKIALYTERLISAGEKDLKEAFWRVISILMEGVAEKWDTIPTDGLKIQLDPYLEAVTFTIHKELPEAQISVFNPKGEKISEHPPRVVMSLKTPRTEIWKVDEPQAGVWTCKIEKGMGKVEVGTMKVPVQPRLLYPIDVHPQGKPFVVWASFLRRDGRPIKEHRAYELKMWADLRYPETEGFYHIDLIETPQTGVFRAKETIKTEKEGEYQIILKMKAHKEIAETITPIKVVKMPYIELLKPKYQEVQPWHKNLIIEAEIRLGNEVISPTEFFIDNPNAIIFYQITDLDKNEVIKSGHLQYLGGEKRPKFWANAGKIKKNGKYRIVLNLRSQQNDGTIYEYSTNPDGTLIYRRMDFIDFLICRPYFWGLIILLILFLWDWQRIGRENEWWGWRIGCPELSGRIEIIEKEEGKEPSEGVDAERIEGIKVVPLKGRKTRLKIKKLDITFIAKKRKEFDEFGQPRTNTKIFIKWEKGARPEEELPICIEKEIGEDTKVHYLP